MLSARDSAYCGWFPAAPRDGETGEEDADVVQTPDVRFEDVSGLADVKKAVNRMLILPMTRPGLLQKYGRRAGGGVLLYGPPGCGKSLVARATAGECELPFVEIRIDQVLSKWIGESEQNVHRLFERARDLAPSVVFVDELDALAFARRKQSSEHSRGLVDQMLQEIELTGRADANVLVLGATNAPWDVDDAFKRPGRFDRVIFVPPPDEQGRSQLLARLLAERPTKGIDIKALAKRTALFSGADLEGLVEGAVDAAIETALETGEEIPIDSGHFAEVLDERQPTTLDWLTRARNFVEFANRSERYRDVAKFLKTKEARRLTSI